MSSPDPSVQAALVALDQHRRPLPPTSHTLTLAEVNQEHTVYLVEVEDEKELAGWLARHHQKLSEEELSGWCTDPALWPRDRSLDMLQHWCSFELHTVVDTGLVTALALDVGEEEGDSTGRKVGPHQRFRNHETAATVRPDV